MTIAFVRCVAFALVASASVVARAQDLEGRWTLSIANLDHKQVSQLVVRFTGERGESCASGSWKQVVVESAETSDPNFFPIVDSLTYDVQGTELVIGRNGVCDAYLRLQGKVDSAHIEGAYYSFGLRGGTDHGEFSLRRITGK